MSLIFGQLEQQPFKETIVYTVYLKAENKMVVLVLKREYPDPFNPDETDSITLIDMLYIENVKIEQHRDYVIRPD